MVLLFIWLLALTGTIVVSVSPPAVQACKHSEKQVVVYRDFVFSFSLEETVLSSRKEVRKLSGHGLLHMTSEGPRDELLQSDI